MSVRVSQMAANLRALASSLIDMQEWLEAHPDELGETDSQIDDLAEHISELEEQKSDEEDDSGDDE